MTDRLDDPTLCPCCGYPPATFVPVVNPLPFRSCSDRQVCLARRPALAATP